MEKRHTVYFLAALAAMLPIFVGVLLYFFPAIYNGLFLISGISSLAVGLIVLRLVFFEKTKHPNNVHCPDANSHC